MLNKYINISIWSCVSLGVALLGYQVFNKVSGFLDYAILFKESVSGLSVGSEALLNGMPVGKIKSIEIFDEDAEKSLVVINAKKLKNKEHLRAEMGMAGLTGHSRIDMYYVKEKAVLPDIKGMMQLESNISFLNKIKQKFDSFANSGTLDLIINSVSQSLDSLKYTFTELRNLLIKLNSFVDNVDGVIGYAPETISKVNLALDSVKDFMKGLDALINESHLSVLLNDDLKAITYSKDDLRKIVRDLREISGAFKRRPMSFLSNGI